MASVDRAPVVDLLTHGAHRAEIGRKQLTLALGGLYIASTTETAKPKLVWELEKGYPRYYVPVEALHEDIKGRLNDSQRKDGTANGQEASTYSIDVATAETLHGRGNDSSAVVEVLSVGAKTTTWVRFTKGPLEGFVRFETKEIDQWFENGAISVAIKNPFKRIDTTAVARHIVVKIDGEIVAETQVAVLLNETGLPETYYIPATSIKNWGAVEKSDLRTACPYKGEAWYLSITVKGKKFENYIWYYQYPTHESAGVEGFISFYRKPEVELLLDGTPL